MAVVRGKAHNRPRYHHHSFRTVKIPTDQQPDRLHSTVAPCNQLLACLFSKQTSAIMNVTLLAQQGHPRCAAALGGGRQHAQTAISPISSSSSSSRQPAARRRLHSIPNQVRGHSSCPGDHPVCLQQPACSHRGGRQQNCAAALVRCAAARSCCQLLATGQRTLNISAHHAHLTVCLHAGGQQSAVADYGGGVADGQVSHEAPARRHWLAAH
jgi:hypothetical protein